jgi:hypothetical protein
MEGPLANFLMLNPSTADEYKNDPTVERQCRRVQAWGCSGLIVTNIFAWRSTDPRQLRRVPDPVGPLNDCAILESAEAASIVVCAWGNHAAVGLRGVQVRSLLEPFGDKLHYLRMSKQGEPCHPLYIGYDVQPERWKR